MGNLNKDIQGVFVNIAGDHSSIPDYEQFINRPSQDLYPEYCLANYIAEYSAKVQQHKMEIQQLAHLEKIIMQIRALSNLAGNVKLYTVRDTYIYARCTFYRNDSDTNEVRLLIDPIDLHFPQGKAGAADLRILSGKTDFMNKVYDKLKIVMRAEINGNITDYKKIYSKNICDIPNIS
jgi:hypothetical protein